MSSHPIFGPVCETIEGLTKTMVQLVVALPKFRILVQLSLENLGLHLLWNISSIKKIGLRLNVLVQQDGLIY